ncbi:hypothetical protein ACNKHK_10545 [Shigella flexneri]
MAAAARNCGYSARFFDALNVILSGHTVSGGDMNTLRMGIDGISQATPLDTFKTSGMPGIPLNR